MSDNRSNARAIEPKYWIRYYVYEDFTRKRAFIRSAYWGDDEVIKDLKYGRAFTMRYYNPEQEEEEYVVTNNAEIVEIPNPHWDNKLIKVFDVFLAPYEQWVLYYDVDPNADLSGVQIYNPSELE